MPAPPASPGVRNVFDQYRQPENRLTHALMATLASDPGLLKRFLREYVGLRRPAPVAEIREQGIAESDENGPHRSPSLPDAWIGFEDGSVLLIESKLGHRAHEGQIGRHRETARARGATNVHVLVISMAGDDGLEPTRRRSWSRLHGWLTREAERSTWAATLADYIRVFEIDRIAHGKLREGTMTKFDGIPFDDDYPYDEIEARRLLRLIMLHLRDKGRRDLVRRLGARPGGEGRTSLRNMPWDFIPFQWSSGHAFNHAPHLDVGLRTDHLAAHLWLPKGLARDFRRRLSHRGVEGLRAVFDEIRARLRPVLRAAPGGRSQLIVQQIVGGAHGWKGRRDARLEFDLDTISGRASKTKGRHPGVTAEPLWLETALRAVLEVRVELGVGAVWPYGECDALRTPRVLPLIEETWLASEPLVRALRGK